MVGLDPECSGSILLMFIIIGDIVRHRVYYDNDVMIVDIVPYFGRLAFVVDGSWD